MSTVVNIMQRAVNSGELEMLINKQGRITPEEYLDFERNSQTRHEYVDGCIYAMSGSVARHAIICMNLYDALRDQVRSCGCEVFTEMLKQRVEATNCYYYPDLMVTCEVKDMDSDVMFSPVLLIEILSRSTSVTDRREKVLSYRHIPSLKEYLIVHQRRRRLELHRRHDDGQWERFTFHPGDEVILESLPGGHLKLSWDAIYARTDAIDSNVVREDEADYDVDW